MKDQDRLLEEYRLVHKYVVALHSRIWEIGAILIAGSLGAFAIVAVQHTIGTYSLVISFIAGIASTCLLVIWYLIRERFAFFMEVSFYRMREIEADLGLWWNRYIDYLDNPSRMQTDHLPDTEQERLERLQAMFRGRCSRIRARTANTALVIVIPLVWLCWIVYQAIVLFT